ncbi:hypothetical protein AB0K67_26775 [Nonomuraea sp. NPDC052634]|uniref:hypothetical protein n=1 Tax=Nonomuraea sp. NPDC052634 TaxID=3155813 RepID=UPI0034358EB2
MSRSLLLASLAAGALTVPAPPASAATEPAIRSITVRPAQPVVGAHGSVRLVIDVIARGVKGKDGVTVKVEPGAPPADAPQPRPATPPVTGPQNPPPGQNGTPGTPEQDQNPGAPDTAQDPATPDDARKPNTPPAQTPVKDEPQENAEPAPQGTADEATQEGATQEGTSQQGATQEGTVQEPAAQGTAGESAQAGAPVTVLAPGREPARPHHILTQARAGEQQPQNTQWGVPQQPGQNAQSIQDGAVTAPKVGVPPRNAEAILPRLVWRRIPVPPARMADGWETWRFLPDKRLNRYYPAGTWTITATAKGRDGKTVTQYASFQLRRESRLSSVRVEKAAKGDGVRLRGSLTRVDPRGLTDFGPFAKQRLDILWRPDTSSAWEKVGQATTDASGAFVQTVQGRTGGYWRVRFAGTGHYAPDNSKVQQIPQ